MPNQVIINADDLGWSPGVTAGILLAHRDGVLTSASLAANMPAAADAVAQAATAPNLGIGVHLNVCQGPPLSSAGQALADGQTGRMNWTPQKLVLACLRRPWLIRAVEAEYEAQIRWVLDHGLRPTHLDSHRHTHAFPPFFRAACRLARRYQIRFLRWPVERLPGSGWAAVSAKQRRVARLLQLFCVANAAMDSSLRGTVGTWGVAHTGSIDAAWLIRAAAKAPAGALEIMAHPGYSHDLDPRDTRLLASRDAELRALCDPAVRAAFAVNHVELVHYGQLVGIEQ